MRSPPTTSVSGTSSEELGERARTVLKILMEQYLRTGEPVGSAGIAQRLDTPLSPASVRNVLADLEERGYLLSPHTSSGRVPTVRGYRFFIDALLEFDTPDERLLARLREVLGRDEVPPEELLARASEMVSTLTHMAALVSVPRREVRVFRHIEFVPLEGRRILAVLLTGDGEIENRLLTVDHSFDRARLEEAARSLNEHFSGRGLEEVRVRLEQEIEKTRVGLERLLASVRAMTETLLEKDRRGEMLRVAGALNLFGFEELHNLARLRELFEALDRQRDILHLFEACARAEGVRIFLGQESGAQALEECALVAAPYRMGEGRIGVLGIVGPRRMDYAHVVPIVRVTAEMLGLALKNTD
jgi:heat-inducible transcriptional repressor